MQPDMNQMMQKMQKAQEAMAKLQDELNRAVVEGSSGGGAVKVTCTGGMDFQGIKISKEAVDPTDVETLEDLILTAIKDACDKAKKLGEQKMSSQLNAMNLQLPPGFGF
jgi:DNA-binding YbaB/EbfC family protein